MGHLVSVLADPGHGLSLDGEPMIHHNTLDIIKMAAGAGMFGAVISGALAYPVSIQIAVSLGGFLGFLAGHWAGSDNGGSKP